MSELPRSTAIDTHQEQMAAFDILMQPHMYTPPEGGFEFSPNSNYERYLRMHKVLVGRRGAEQLEAVHASLSQETLPSYLDVAGWAAAEVALIRSDKPIDERQLLLDSARSCWWRAMDIQKYLNAAEIECMTEYAFPYRMALDIAVVPLLEGIVRGEVAPEVRESVFQDCLNIAQSNLVRLQLMNMEGNVEGIGEHYGFGYECNAVLGHNRMLDENEFAIPAMARSDSGHYYEDQTHDLLHIRLNDGRIESIIPVEIKSHTSKRDRDRYKALLVRGKIHLSRYGMHQPIDTLHTIGAAYEGVATPEETGIAEEVTDRFKRMIQDYRAGEKLGDVATARSVTAFHDNQVVVANHVTIGIP